MLRDLLRHRVTIRKLALDAAGNEEIVASYGAVQALVVPASETVADGEGQETPVKAKVYLLPNAPIDVTHPDWRIEHGGLDMEVISINPQPDARTGKTHHYEVLTR